MLRQTISDRFRRHTDASLFLKPADPVIPLIRNFVGLQGTYDYFWKPPRLHWLFEQFHSCLFWSPVALFVVARTAARNDVLPRRSSSTAFRQNVIVSQLRCWEPLLAELTGPSVPRVDKMTLELHRLDMRVISTQSHHGRHLDLDGRRSQYLIVFADYVDLVEPDHRDGTLPRYYAHRLVSNVQ